MPLINLRPCSDRLHVIAEQTADLGRRLAMGRQQHKVGTFGHAFDRLPINLAQFTTIAIMDFELEHVGSPWLVW
jgi:hypothetical protein